MKKITLSRTTSSTRGTGAATRADLGTWGNGLALVLPRKMSAGGIVLNQS